MLYKLHQSPRLTSRMSVKTVSNFLFYRPELQAFRHLLPPSKLNFGITGVHVTMEWDSPHDDAQAIGLIQNMGQAIRLSAIKHDADIPFIFMNDAYDGQQVLSGYGAGNLAKLRNIAKAYDPEGVFQRLQNGGWLLSRENV